MKPDRSPLATMSKRRQRRQLYCDTIRYQRRGGRIRKIASGTARGLCSLHFETIELLRGHACEL